MTKNAMILVIVLLASLATGCSREVRTVYVQPICTPAPKPTLPDLSRGVVWDYLLAGAPSEDEGRDVYRRLEVLENRLVAWGRENAAIIRSVCRETAAPDPE